MNPTTFTLTQALQHCQRQGLERLDAQMLVLLACGQGLHQRAWLLTHDGDVLTDAQQASLQAALARRLSGEPMAYITGSKEFFGLSLQVDARVLDPRPDTETLVEWALELLQERQSARVVDLGTGSGAIALALKSQCPSATVEAVDYSADALAVARANAQRLQLDVRFAQGSWLEPVVGAFDLIVSNPPYIAAADPHLAALRHEPLSALASGADGLDDIRTIIAQSMQHLLRGGWLLLEHGYDQAQEVQALLTQAGFAHAQSRHDLAGIARCTGAQWPGVAANA
ncbi:peptide chain release factor N(5)-glutamine methyltransferase [Curvibacter sp. APW13]|uniref:peptide chain release factor N(5)-glutamine methyltransferase n=1 Tax=Curvibacter sp. APW13 TaxID=3077236 RepID=UPI0028DE551B|nr:peptide chain release factor N(5)-glutamine methyltransferase [Curvibacter sp. APW13]MDT8992400.1 peptide chain release factor N(5)-glutamine methyltransferase [Curvibacter sp. APW13]